MWCVGVVVWVWYGLLWCVVWCCGGGGGVILVCVYMHRTVYNERLVSVYLNRRHSLVFSSFITSYHQADKFAATLYSQRKT